MAGFPGFDTSQYPGDQVMSWLKRNTNLTWTGFYLGVAPSHSQADWMNRRAVLVEQGWGFAPVYLGQQTTGPGSHDSSGPQGTIDGGQAVALMQAAGFPAGRCVYLDIENGPPLSALQIAYIAAWVNEVVAQGFQAGVYCSHLLAAQVHAISPAARIWAFRVSTSAPHPVPGTNFPDLHPAGCGYAGAFAWQLGQECLITVPPAPQQTLQVDLDTAVTADPSA
jgi:hypothetical protein